MSHQPAAYGSYLDDDTASEYDHEDFTYVDYTNAVGVGDGVTQHHPIPRPQHHAAPRPQHRQPLSLQQHNQKTLHQRAPTIDSTRVRFKPAEVKYTGN